MNPFEADAAIKNIFATAWNNATQVAYDDDGSFKIPNGQSWLRFNVKFVDGYQASTGAPGGNKFRKEGLVTVSVFCPGGGAGIEAMQLVDQVASVFEGKSRAQGILFKNVRVVSVGPDGAGWYQINVKADFEYDTTK